MFDISIIGDRARVNGEMPIGLANALADIVKERLRQDAKWGEQNHPDGTGPERSWGLDDPGSAREIAEVFREETDHKVREGKLTWRDIALEEIAEAFAEDDPELLRAELNQVSAVFAAWAEAITRRVS